MTQTVVLEASGLVTSPNQLNLKNGSLVEAKNIVIQRENIIEPRRGFNLYGTSLPLAGDRVKQLSLYRQRILRHYSNILQYDSDDNGTFVNFSGSFLEAVSGLRIKSIESNGNFYFASSEGIKKISAKNSNDFANIAIGNSGVVKALDLDATNVYEYKNQSGFLPQDSSVAYRILFGTKDRNENLIRGTPSQRSVVTSSLQLFLINDFLRVLLALDNVTDTTDSARIGDGDYFSSLGLEISASASQLRANFIALATKLDLDIVYGDDGTSAPIDLVGASGTCEVNGNVATITKQSGADFTDYLESGSLVEISGLVGGNAVLNGNQTLVLVGANTITFNITTPNFGPSATDSTVKLKSNKYRSITVPSIPNTPATNAELLSMQVYLDTIISNLQSEPPVGSMVGIVISSADQTEFITPLDITTNSNVKLTFTLPEELTTDYFYQIYRSPTTTATGVTSVNDLSPSDELQLTYESYLTTDNISDGFISILDETPEEFLGENLYTNASSGEGITQSNDTPPFAKDINRFRNVVFFANTQTKYRLQLSILGIQKLIEDYNNSIIPKITIFSGNNSQVYSFVVGKKEETNLTCVADIADSLNGKYFDKKTANNEYAFRFYYKTSGGADTPPSSTGIDYLVKININTGETANNVAQKTRDIFSLYAEYFIAEDNTLPTIKIDNTADGYCDDLNVGTSGFSKTVVVQGIGESESNKEILLSSLVSPARAVEETAKSLIRIINKNNSESVYATYLSSSFDIPGKILLESRELINSKFYVISNNTSTGSSFNPDISPELIISAINTTTDVITTSTNHGLLSGDQIIITQTDTVPNINGLYTVEKVSNTEIKIGIDITTVNTLIGNISTTDYAISGDNESKQNRIYFSKYQQPESVPITNYFDVGAEDKEILRIYPLRDTLFVFKADGLYRVSGEVAPFNVQLFDSSTVLIAPDSIGVVDNLLYAWTLKGIVAISESGVQNISRDIDNIILKIGSKRYTNFINSTWGIGYESDNTYFVFTINESDDMYAKIGYRYNTLTQSWTTIEKDFVCGIINQDDNKLYVGAGDINYIEKERKNYDRTDYSDREYTLDLSNTKYSQVNKTILLSDVSNVEIGDVITQEQTLTVYDFNALLKQIDKDPTAELGLEFGDPDGYFKELEMIAGDNPRTVIVSLANRLDSDPGITQGDFSTTIAPQTLTINNISVASETVITTSVAHNLFTGRVVNITGTNSTPDINGNYEVTVLSPTTFSIQKEVLAVGSSGTAITQNQNFLDIKACYNKIVEKMNDDDTLSFQTYVLINETTFQESIIDDVSDIKKSITLRNPVDFIVGDIILYKSIHSDFTYAPNTMGDPINGKHIRYAQILFENRAFTSGTMSFSTDLIPEFQDIIFDLDGNGIFGNTSFGSGFFGGSSNSAPMRTIVPRICQRCIYVKIKITHNIAREFYNIYGISLTGQTQVSERAYR